MIINLKSETNFSGFYIVYKGSVMNEIPENYGISHFAEHLLCKEFEHLYDDFERYSIDWNAYTDNTYIVIFITGLDEYINRYKHKLLESLSNITFTKEQFEIEKKIIIEEYNDYFQDQSSIHYLNLYRKELGFYGSIGKYQSIKNITYEEIINYIKTYLIKPSLIINISKNNGYNGFSDFNYVKPLTFIKKDKNIILERNIEFDKVSIIGYKQVNSDFAYIDFINEMLSSSLKSPLYLELREKRGLTYGVDMNIDHYSDLQGMLSTTLITDKNNVNQCLDIYKDVMLNPKKYLTEDRFNIIKDNLIIEYKKEEINRYENIYNYLLPKEWDINMILDKLSYNKILDKYYEYFNFNEFKWNMQ
jgi:predicted Zn-dependent peptidase